MGSNVDINTKWARYAPNFNNFDPIELTDDEELLDSDQITVISKSYIRPKSNLKRKDSDSPNSKHVRFVNTNESSYNTKNNHNFINIINIKNTFKLASVIGSLVIITKIICKFI
jgi:hypothetical protein